jgi:phosphoribosylformylglycinamidine synthase subunit PurS
LNRYSVEVRVKPRVGLLDPQGKAVHHALGSLGYTEVASVRVGRLLDMEVEADSPETAQTRAREMCERLLANPVTEDFQISVTGEVQSS